MELAGSRQPQRIWFLKRRGADLGNSSLQDAGDPQFCVGSEGTLSGIMEEWVTWCIAVVAGLGSP